MISTHSSRSDRAINCFSLCFFLIFLTIKFKIEKKSFAVSKTYPQNIRKFWCKCDKNFTGTSFKTVFLPLKGSLYTSSSASLDVPWVSSVAEITEKIFQLCQWSQLCAITTSALILAYLVDSSKHSSRSGPKNWTPELKYT